MNYRTTIGFALLAVLASANIGSSQTVTDALNWESANAKRMFILTNGASPISAISLDTTNKVELQAAVKLQELIARLGGARLPLVDKQYVRVPWGMIHIKWDHYPMAERQHPFTIEMNEFDSTAFNPAKQIVIGGGGNEVERAVSTFTQSAFGVPLNALDDKSYRWTEHKLLAIPEKMKSIQGTWQRNE